VHGGGQWFWQWPSSAREGCGPCFSANAMKRIVCFRTDTVRMIRKLKSGKYRLYSRNKDPKTGKRRNLGTFSSRSAAKQHERAVQFFKRH
jgi:hypothetical protein